MPSPKIAIIHDWLVSQRGGENVLDAICELFPNADLFTLVYEPGQVSDNIIRLKRHTSILQKLPQATRRYRHMLPLMPFAIEKFDMHEYDVILSSSHCVAKGVKKRSDAWHASYVHAPMRYMWDRFDEYFGPGRYSIPVRAAARALRSWLQNWDRTSATRVDHFMTNSNFIAGRVKELYSRDSEVVYPFCEPEAFSRPRDVKDFYLIVTALVPYKRVDLAIEAFTRMKKKLYIVGDGPDLKRLKKMAGPTIEFLPPLKRDGLADLYSKCKALIFPGIEDFGIVPCEAMAAGAPVIALGKGGALETVTEKTGVLFGDLSPEALMDAVARFERRQQNPASAIQEKDCRQQGAAFNRARFQREYLASLAQHAPQSLKDLFVARSKIG